MALPTDMDITDFFQCSPSTRVANIAHTSSTSTVAMPASSESGAADEEQGAMLVSGCLGTPVSMEQEFKMLEESSGWPQAYLELTDQSPQYRCQVAQALENRSRNRYRHVNPFDHSRVGLKVATPAPGGGFHPGLGLALAVAQVSYTFSSTSTTVGSQGGVGGGEGLDVHNDYINASYVVMEEAQRSYILAQGPLPNTCGHFWLMVWQQNSRAVIMLNQLVEKGSIKCSQYWPSCQGQTLLFEEIGIRVHMLGEEVKAFHRVRYLKLESVLSGEFRDIFHLQYTSWPDFGVPESPGPFLGFLFMVWESGFLNCEEGPAVIHSSASIGRSGTFALIDSCLVLMGKRENPFSVNIRQVLLSLRKYRMRLIKSPEELRFSYRAVIKGAKILMGDENSKKKWKKLTSIDQGPSYYDDDLPPQKYREYRLALGKDNIESGKEFSPHTTGMLTGGEGSGESSRKRLREEMTTNTEEEVLQNREKTCEIEFKRKRENPQNM